MSSAIENNISLHDATLPGLQTLLDAQAFGQLLQLNGMNEDIADLHPHYIKYKPGVSCLVGYSITSNNKNTFVYARTHAEAYAHKLSPENDEQTVVLGELGLAQFTTADPPIIVYPFPNDHELKSLKRLADTAWRERLLERIFPDNPTYWTGIILPMRYKPERRFVCKLIIDNEPVAVLKFYLQQDFNRANENIRSVQKCGKPAVSQKIRASSKHKVLAFNWIEGENLESLKQEPAQWLQTGEIVGASLLDLHNCDAFSNNRLDQDYFLDALNQNLELLEHLNDDLANQFRNISQRLRDTALPVLSQECFVHGDLSLDQLIYQDKKLTYIDFDRAGMGDPAIDLGRLIAELHFAVLRESLSKHQAASAMKGLLTAYSYEVNATLSWYTAMSLLQLSLKPFRYCWDKQGPLIASVIQRAGDILENGCEID